MTENDIKMMNKTARSNGAVGQNAIIPRYIVSHPWMHSMKMLDFGSGKLAIHTKMLREIHSLDVDPYDMGDNFVEGFHLKMDEFTKESFKLVFASNVINVQPNEECLIKTLIGMSYFLHPDGICIFNFPSSPRKMKGLTKKKLIGYVCQIFKSCMVENYEGNTIFVCQKDGNREKVKVSTKIVLYWTCPACGTYNEIEDRVDKVVPDILECDNIDCLREYDWEM